MDGRRTAKREDGDEGCVRESNKQGLAVGISFRSEEGANEKVGTAEGGVVKGCETLIVVEIDITVSVVDPGLEEANEDGLGLEIDEGRGHGDDMKG